MILSRLQFLLCYCCEVCHLQPQILSPGKALLGTKIMGGCALNLTQDHIKWPSVLNCFEVALTFSKIVEDSVRGLSFLSHFIIALAMPVRKASVHKSKSSGFPSLTSKRKGLSAPVVAFTQHPCQASPCDPGWNAWMISIRT